MTELRNRKHMPRVFVVQDTGKNLLPAKEFGELEVCTHSREDAGMLRARLESFCKGDFLLLLGSPVLIGIAVHTILEKFGSVTCLVWDRDHYKYKQQHVE